VLDGYRTIFASRDLRLLVALYVAQTVVAGASVVYEVSIALDLLDLGESGLGVLNAALGVGGVVGGVLALLLAQRGKQARDFGLGVVLWAAPLLLVAAVPSVATAVLAMVLIGLGNSVVDVNAETIIQRLVPDDVLGRVFGALDSAAIGGMAVGAAAMPLLINTVGLRTGLVVIGVAVSAVVAVSLDGLRRIDKVALAPEGLSAVLGVPMLAVLPEHTVERLARTSTVVDVLSGSPVFNSGEIGDRFYIIELGTADVIVDGQVVASVGAGDSFGEIALLRDVPRTATVLATQDLRVRAIDREYFLPAVTGHAEAADQAELVVGRLMGGS
jgi:MFS family permease